MKRIAVLGGLWLALLGAPLAWAQSPSIYGRAIAAYPDLSFGNEAKELGLFSSVGNSVFKPGGAGPFPAVVLAHTCGGLQAHITDRAKDLLAAGFVVLVLDAYGPRNHTAYCQPRGVLAPRVYKDAFDALAHLSQMKEVDADRIYLVGLSLGSFVASSAARPGVGAAGGQRPALPGHRGLVRQLHPGRVALPQVAIAAPRHRPPRSCCCWRARTPRRRWPSASRWWSSSRPRAGPWTGTSTPRPPMAGTKATHGVATCTAPRPRKTRCGARWNSCAGTEKDGAPQSSPSRLSR